MKGKDFFNNLRDTDEKDFDFSLPTTTTSPTTAEDVVNRLAIGQESNNINVTITLNRDLFNKIERIQEQIQKKSGGKVSKSKIITKICEQYLAEFSVE